MKTSKNEEKLYGYMASQYVRIYGEALQRERKELDLHEPDLQTPGLDARVAELLQGKQTRQKRRYLPVAGAIAACFLVFFALRGLNPTNNPIVSPQPVYEVIPLSYELPANFTVAGYEQDQGQTIYFVEDTWKDDVVIALEQAQAPLDTTGMQAIPLENATVYGKSTADYSLVMFEKDSVQFVMTCRYDINTLLSISRSIL